ncbi:hypothetical protein APHCRT_1620 [Anaplasma phagocytophilum str. CRT53-1]|uniref:Uncharacterized protein n=1 Tax=Anaplasma phagocytophilum str. CRT53-1 TaxID=1359157 RepID=A0A0F3PJ65_ANAPH|nr:hypothetical protein APHCRT_1620 [Anaplasma phagocytophilum str. CRT53-1]
MCVKFLRDSKRKSCFIDLIKPLGELGSFLVFFLFFFVVFFSEKR